MHKNCTFLLICYALIGFIAFEAVSIHTSYAHYAQTYNYATYSEHNEKHNVVYLNNPITIFISASTNTCDITMNIFSTSRTTYRVCSITKHGTLPAILTHTFFKDVYAAQPLDELPQETCFKPVSFSTTTHIWFQGYKSPDVSCSTDFLGKRLNNDVQDIYTALHITD